jgi:hypothetical protein
VLGVFGQPRTGWDRTAKTYALSLDARTIRGTLGRHRDQERIVTVTPSQLRVDIYRLLDEVLETGVALEVRRGDRVLEIVPKPSGGSRLDRLVRRPDLVAGDPGDLPDLPDLHWTPSGEPVMYDASSS